MNEGHKPDEIVEYPGGITEQPGGKVPVVLKLTYVGFVLFAIIYFILYVAGDGSSLVELLNQATGHANP